jgi:signal transduction histidine kinase
MAEDLIDDLRKKLSAALSLKRPDFGLLLRLTNQLTALDPEFVRFSADAGLIARLGRELVARQETALSEIVKNAYDADATYVTLTFVDAVNANGRLVVEDDGHGMTRQSLIDGFMRLASPAKVAQPTTPRFARMRAGRKGLGRFAAQRLGHHLELITQTADSTTALKVSLDWDSFVSGLELGEIANRIELVPKQRPSGTTLTIELLEDSWSDAQIARSYRYVEELLTPFPTKEFATSTVSHASLEAASSDLGFRATFYRRDGIGEAVEVASEERMVFQYALAKVTATIDSDGYGTMQIEGDRLGVGDQQAIGPTGTATITPYNHLRDVRLTAYYFIYHPDLIPRNESARIRRLANDQGGFRLYLNGFRVLPYGEKNNDWLGLDEESRKRSILPGIANINWFGAIEVPDRGHTQFSEVSSREGLNKNDAYDELVAFGREVAINAALRTATLRDRKQTAGQKKVDRPTPNRLTPDVLRAIAGEIESAIAPAKQPDIFAALEETEPDGSNSRPLIGESAHSLLESAAQTVRAAADVNESLMQELEMLRVLSSLGLMIGMFTHEARTKLLAIRSAIEGIIPLTLSNVVTTDAVANLSKQAKLLQSYLSYFDVAISANVRREVSPQDVSKLLYQFVEQFEPMAGQSAVELSCEIEEDLVSAPMHESEWASILGNMLSNSMKAIHRGKIQSGRIHVKGYQINDRLVLEFSDNGDGIPKENQDRIFEAFFTTTNVSFNDELTGMGLGLKIVRDIVESRGGEIYVVEAPRGYSTCMRIEVSSGFAEGSE